MPCVFVRLTGCNLRCTWCDTAYAFHGGKRTTIDAICNKVDELAGRGDGQHGSQAPVHLVEITGGEPLLQEGVYALAQTLLDDGYTVMIETSGERFIGKLPEHVIKIVDVKCPDSGAPNTFEYRNLDALSHNDEVKFVISSRNDYEFAREFVRKHHLDDRVREVLFSPSSTTPKASGRASSQNSSSNGCSPTIYPSASASNSTNSSGTLPPRASSRFDLKDDFVGAGLAPPGANFQQSQSAMSVRRPGKIAHRTL